MHSEASYDNNGNTLTDVQGRSFTWDFENRLVQAIVPGTNGGTTTFRYDPFGRRIQKSGPLGTTNYLYDRRNLVEEVDGSGNVLASYTQSKSIDQPLAQLRSGTTSYYQQDGLGSVTSLSSTAGALAETYTYDSYGRTTASTGTITNPFQYTGRQFDSETGIYYYRARYFDPGPGRFLSEDPIQFGGGANFYAYTRNNPVLRNDPFGYYSGSGVVGSMYLAPDGVWYNDGPSLPSDTSGVCSPQSPNACAGPQGQNEPDPYMADPNKKCDKPKDQPREDQPPSQQPQPPTTTDDCNSAWWRGLVSTSADIVGVVPGFGNVVSGIAAGAGIAAGIPDDNPTGAASSGVLLGLAAAEGAVKGGKVIPILGNLIAFGAGLYDGYQWGETMVRCGY